MSCLREKFDNVLLDGRFETLAPLNHGSFGMVFMARDHSTNELVAIKCLTKQSAPNNAGLTFSVDDKSEELSLHRRLGLHPNIVNLVHSFETDAHIYLVLEFCSRGDLYEAIRNGQGPLETERVRQFMLELVDAVAHMHSRGIYHRDIKPENIFLTESGNVKLGDFGLATTENWSMENAVGSDRYMSPEQYDSAGSGYSPAQADVWAVGICLLNVLFSRNPFTTPTEADPIFLDFSRDKQSLFDVFPTISQDTYEVIVQCMNLDPRKRSLSGARDALCRLANFTTEEALDDFCSTGRKAGASMNREPLRTPSLQSPQPEYGAFPWLKTVQPSRPRPIGRLGTILDDESCSEELFPSSGETSADWFSGVGQTPSTSSDFDSCSRLGMSMASSLAVGRPILQQKKPGSRVSPAAGSLPITMSRPRAVPPVSVLSSSAGRKQGFSKSWSEMWDEDIEEEEEEHARQLQALKELNSRTWSRESRDEAISLAFSGSGRAGEEDDIDELVEDGFFLHDAVAERKHAAVPTTIRPPQQQQQQQQSQSSSRRNDLDKWAALGERRRAYTGGSESDKSPDLKPRRGGYGFGFSGGNIGGDFSPNHAAKPTKERARDRPSFNKARDGNWRRDRRTDHGDAEWVGGLF